MLAHDRRGAGPPLVLLHPLGADREVWAPVLDRVAAEREVLTVDLPGFGGSPPLEEKPTPDALARAVDAFLQAEGVARPHVAGNSLGGWVALELALAGGARSVTAIAPAGLWPQPLLPRRGTARQLARLGRPVAPLLARNPGTRALLLGGTVARPARVPPDAAVHLVEAYGGAPGFDAVNEAMRAGRFTGLERLHVPLTFAWCEHDRLVSRPRRMPCGVTEIHLEGCGHVPMWDDPDAVARVLLEGSAQGPPSQD